MTHDLNQPANALWMPAGSIPATGAIWGGETRHFASLYDAISFVMEDLSSADKTFAWITIDNGSLNLKGIEAIYRNPDFPRKR
jgi:hypothetical protein